MNRVHLLGAAFGAAMLAQPLAALAQPLPAEATAPAARAPVLDAVLACRAQTDPQARLACYDAAAGRLEQAQSSGDVVVVDRAQVRQARRTLFGLTLPSIDLFDRGPSAEADRVDAITSTIAGSSVGRDSHTTFRLADASVWRQVENEYVRARVGDAARVERGMLGSFFMSIGSQPRVRVQRIQ